MLWSSTATSFAPGMERTHTLEEVGQIFGVTRERIRQIEAKAIRKLRHPTRAKKLGDYRDSGIPGDGNRGGRR